MKIEQQQKAKNNVHRNASPHKFGMVEAHQILLGQFSLADPVSLRGSLVHVAFYVSIITD